MSFTSQDFSDGWFYSLIPPPTNCIYKISKLWRRIPLSSFNIIFFVLLHAAACWGCACKVSLRATIFLPTDRKKLISPHVGLRMLVICVGILLLGLKGYLLHMVWLCYKFLLGFSVPTENSMVFSVDSGCYSFPFLRYCRRNQRPLEDCTSGYSLIAQPPIENSSLPPKYEDVVNTIPNSSGPPTYDTVLNTAALGDVNTLSTGMNAPSPPSPKNYN
uniref:Uncharacterized protein n=1 Tax=Trichobilharzia regenti TaxID=157069 RepID=A0AA85JZZ8_TRIRE|nr:unnamed protein product [Trichobilharzia regenti]